MKIHLISHTNQPLKSIAAACLNIGIGRDIATLDNITQREAADAFQDTTKSFLTAPLEFASFNFFWQDVPIFVVRELVRHRIGWSYAERSLRFYDASLRNPLDNIDIDFTPSFKGKPELEQKYRDFIKSEMDLYEEFKQNGIDAQDARNVIGVWYPTALQTACTYRALRDSLALRLSSQAHPAWKEVARQIKEHVTIVDSFLGSELRDVCDIQGRCVWQSKLDRPCDDCAKRGRQTNHVHFFDSKMDKEN